MSRITRAPREPWHEAAEDQEVGRSVDVNHFAAWPPCQPYRGQASKTDVLA